MNHTTNYRHAAVVLKSLPKKIANKFLAGLDPLQSQRIVMEMRGTQVTAANLREAIARLEADGLGDSSSGESFSSQERIYRIDEARAGGSFGQNVGLVAQPNLDFSGSGTVSFEKKPFEYLNGYQSNLLNRVFLNLKVRSAAVILSTMSFEFALERLNAMEATRKVQVMRGISDLDDLHPAEISDLKFAVRLQIQNLLKKEPQLNQNPERFEYDASLSEAPAQPVKEIQVSGQQQKTSLLENGKRIAGLLKMPDAQVKKLLKTIDTSDLAPALKTCPIAVQKKVLKNMAKKPAAIVSNEILKVRIDEKHRISKARRSIASAIERLEN
jgi:flagellar motor switch protein FliG